MLLPETVIDDWRRWDAGLDERPIIRGPLNGGRSNQSFLLESGNVRLVLRVNSTDSLLPGNKRDHEATIWKAASLAGIAPPLLYTDKDNRFVVSRYIDNSLPAMAPRDEAYARQALDLLKRCHELDIVAPGIDYAGHIEHYWQMIEVKGLPLNTTLAGQRGPMRSTLESLLDSDTPTGLCHHDPIVANFVGNTDRLYLIDWEYAARGLLIMDYAALGVEWGVDEELLLEQTGFEADMLVSAMSVYRYLCDLWQEAM